MAFDLNQKVKSLKQTAQNKTWASFYIKSSVYTPSLVNRRDRVRQKDVWLLQDEMTFETKEFDTIETAISWIGDHMSDITDIL
ncbi:DUF2552 family protein [Bacillus licheniformis]|nr:DUF2552 family protein [Bacillus licheniformis]